MDFVNIVTSSPIASLLGAVLVTAVGGIIAEFYRRREQTLDDTQLWYRDALGMISRVQRVGHQATEYQRNDYKTLREKLDPLADELQEHAAGAPTEIPEDPRQELHFLAAFCTGLIALFEKSAEVNSVEFLQAVQESACESYDGEYTIEFVNELIEPIDTGKIIGDRSTEDVEANEEIIDDFLAEFDDESVEQGQVQSIDEALEMPLGMLNDILEDEAIWDEMIGDTVREYVRLILIDITEDINDAMEQRMQRI